MLSAEVLDYIEKVIIVDMNCWLIRELEEKKVREVVFQLGSLKTLCLDWFNGLFSQMHQKEMGSFILRW